MSDEKRYVQDAQAEILDDVADASPDLPYKWEAAVGAVLREIRESRGWSQAFAVDRLRDEWQMDMHQTTLAKLEAGKRPIRLAELYALSLLYGQSVLMVIMQESVRSQMIPSADRVDAFYFQEVADIDRRLSEAVDYLRLMTDSIAGRKAVLQITHGYLSRNAEKLVKDRVVAEVESDGTSTDAAQ